MQIRTRTKNAIFYLENEAVRGLMMIISAVGLSLKSLHETKESLVQGILFHLERGTLRAIRLQFLDVHGKVIENGFGVWRFDVSYEADGIGVIEFPVRKVVDEIQRNKLSLASAHSYEVILSIDAEAELPQGWCKRTNTRKNSPNSTFLDTYGWDSLRSSVHRE